MNRKLTVPLLMFTSIICLVVVVGCGKKSPSIVGKWIGEAPNGDKITYEFKQDNTVLWTVHAKDSPGSVSAKYVVDYSTNPVNLDIFEFNLLALNEFIFLGIVEFHGDNKMLLYGEPSEYNKGSRPTGFSDDAIEFSRSE